MAVNSTVPPTFSTDEEFRNNVDDVFLIGNGIVVVCAYTLQSSILHIHSLT